MLAEKVKQNESRLNNASKNQMESMRGQFVKKSQDAEEYNRAQGQPNKADTPPETGDTSNPSSEQTKKSKPARNKFGKNIVYPLGLGNSKQDIIMFSMLQYQPKNITSSSGQFGFGDRRF